MAKQNAQSEIIDLTELIERGPNTEDLSPASAEGKTKEESKANVSGEPVEARNQAQALNDPPTDGNDSDLDILLAQIAKSPEVDSEPKKPLVDDQEKLDMSGLDEADDLLGDLKMPERSVSQSDTEEKNAIDELLNNAAPAESPKETPKADEIKESVDNDLNQLLADLDKETAQTSNTAPEAQPTAKNPATAADDIDALMSQLDQPSGAKQSPDDLDALLGEIQAQTGAAEPAPKEAPAPKAAQASMGDDLDALMSQLDQKPEAKQAPAADDIDALLGEMQAQTEQASKAKPAQAPKAPATDDLDALMSQLDQKPEAKQAPAADDIDALLGEMQAQTEQASKAKPAQAPEAPATDEVDALLGEIQTQVAQSEPAQKEAAAA
ncbi:MAG: hypothetical protein J5846_03555, partial [Desulfovibrio sp.]|nr:hypothetical protein [Desulfovibrio sp.]